MKLLQCDKIKNTIKNEKNIFIFCLLATFAWGMICHAYGFLHSNFSHDCLTGFFASTDEELCKVELGRFAVPLYRIMRGPLVLPWLLGVISLVWMSASVYMVTKIFDIKSRLTTALVSGVMVTNITVTALVGTYLFELDFDMFALMLSVAAVLVWQKCRNPLWLIAGGVLVALSIGIYQAYASVTVSLIMIVCALELLRGEKLASVILRAAKGVAMMIIGCIIYFALSTLVCTITQTPLLARTDVTNMDGVNNIPLFYLSLIKETYLHFVENIVNTEVYPAKVIKIISAVSLLVILFGVIYTFIKNKKITLPAKIFTLLIFVFLPFAMDITYFLAKGIEVHHLTIYAFCFVYVILLVLSDRFRQICNLRFASLLPICACIITAVLLWQNIILANTLYLKKDMEEKATMSLMTRVVSDVEECEGYVHGKTRVAFIGNPELSKPIPGFERVSKLTGASHDMPVTYLETYYSYMNYTLKYPMRLCYFDTLEALKASDEVKNMPCYPHKGSIKLIDGAVVVKLGNY